MTNYKIAVIVGSLRRDSFNKKLAAALIALAPADFTFELIAIDHLPLYDQDDDANQAASVKDMKAQIANAQGVLFVTPEYNRSIPGVLKNAIDQGSRPYGQGVWGGKPAAILGISPGALGTSMAQQHLRNILAFLDMPTMGQPEVFLQMKDGLFDESGHIGPASHDYMQSWMNKFTAWVKKIAG